MSDRSFDPCGCPAHHDSHRPGCSAQSEPIEPDAILSGIGSASLAWQGEGDASAGPDADTSWIEAAGFDVTRSSPPVGSVTIGVPGVGFDLYVPGEHGVKQLAEAYGPDGQRTDRSVLTGAKVPGMLSEADGDKGKGTDDTVESESTPIDAELLNLGIVHDPSLDY